MTLVTLAQRHLTLVCLCEAGPKGLDPKGKVPPSTHPVLQRGVWKAMPDTRRSKVHMSSLNLLSDKLTKGADDLVSPLPMPKILHNTASHFILEYYLVFNT